MNIIDKDIPQSYLAHSSMVLIHFYIDMQIFIQSSFMAIKMLVNSTYFLVFYAKYASIRCSLGGWCLKKKKLILL